MPALSGWRREIFGADALALKHGRLALTSDGRRVKVVPIGTLTPSDPGVSAAAQLT